jgi:LysR family transcriptional regulator, hydrogen peroxide-inducible genes activator
MLARVEEAATGGNIKRTGLTPRHVTLRQLQCLVALAETGHFGRAAERCLITQPAFSGIIRKLEGSLGLRLFERTSRRLEITPAGERVLAEAQQAVAAASAFEVLAQPPPGTVRERLSLGITPTLAPYLLPRLLHPLSRDWPELDLGLRESLTDVLLAKLGAGEIDAALVALPVRGPGLVTEPLFAEPLRAALPSGHALLAEAELTPAALAAAGPLVLLRDGHRLRIRCSPSAMGRLRRPKDWKRSTSAASKWCGRWLWRASASA